MTEQHPLTDSKALSLFSFKELMDGSQSITIEDAMRKAADWQLEECVEEVLGMLTTLELGGKITEEESNGLLAVFTKSMRPQQQEDN